MYAWGIPQVLYALVEQGLKKYDVQQYGVAQYLYATGTFWFAVLACGLISFGHRIIERGYVWLFRPQVLHTSLPPPQSRSRPCQPSGCWPRSHYILAHFLSFGLLSSFGPLSSGSPCPGKPCACKEACRGQCSPPPPTWSMPPVERPAHGPA